MLSTLSNSALYTCARFSIICLLAELKSLNPFLFPSSSLPDVLRGFTELIWREGILVEAMTGRTAPSADCLLAEGLWGFPQL